MEMQRDGERERERDDRLTSQVFYSDVGTGLHHPRGLINHPLRIKSLLSTQSLGYYNSANVYLVRVVRGN